MRNGIAIGTSLSSGGRASPLAATALLVVALTACASSVPGAHVSGTVTYRERMALPPDAVVDVRLEDVSRADATAPVVAEREIHPTHSVPIPFELEYDAGSIDPRHTYSVRATIRRGDAALFVTDHAHPVITRGHPTHVDLVLARSGGGTVPVADAALVGTRWVLRTLAGETIAPGEKPPFLQLDASEDSLRAFGDSGCNRFSGGCVVEGSDLQFGPMAVTRMACPEPVMQLESRFLAVLGEARRYEIRGTWLIVAGPESELATFEAWYE